MTTLSNTHPAPQQAAARDLFFQLVQGVRDVLASLSRAIMFARQCEAEFNRRGQVFPETMKRMIAQV